MKKVIILFLISVSFVIHSQQLDWMQTAHYECTTDPQGMDVDIFGNIYICGNYGISPGGNSSGTNGYFIQKYSPAGTLMWADTSSGESWGVTGRGGVVCDPIGNAYFSVRVMGSDSIRIGNLKYPPSKMYIIKYNPGGQIIWVKSEVLDPYGMARDAQGFIYVTGSGFTNKYDQMGNLQMTIPDGSTYISIDELGNIHLPGRKYSATGAQIWINSAYYSSVIAADSIGNTYMSNLASWGNYSYLTKVSPTGQYLWGITVPYHNGGAIKCDKNGNVYVTGEDSTGMLITKYDSNGNLQWNWHKANPVLGSVSPHYYFSANGDINLYNGNVYFSGLKNMQCMETFLVKLTEPGSTTSLYEHKLDYSITISPNPSSSEFLISFKTLGKESLTIKVMDALGKLLYTKGEILFTHHLKEILDLSHIPKGIYFVQINTGKVSEVRKIVLE